jgi:hypothetical protein
MEYLVTAIAVLAPAIAGLVAALFLKSFLPSYMGEKAKNLATKEDIAEITKRLEGVKSEIGSRLHVHQRRYEHEFALMLELSEKLVELRDAARSLRPVAGYLPADPVEDKKRRRIRFNDANQALYAFRESRKPFFPAEIYSLIEVFDTAAWKEFVADKHRDPLKDENYWEQAIDNQEKIAMLAENILDAIRDRVQRWEKFDPGP